MSYRIKNWEKFQHYKFRNPTWIKLYRDILDDLEWHKLPAEANKVLVMLWLIASDTNGILPNTSSLSFRLRISEQKTNSLLSMLSHWIECDDSDLLANGYPDAMTEKSRVEKSREEIRPSDVPKTESPVFGVEQLMNLWNSTAHQNLPRVQILNKQREVHANSRLKDFPEKGFWENIISKINESSFLTGMSSHWKCDFNWILNSTNLTKILEGNYVDHAPTINRNKNRYK